MIGPAARCRHSSPISNAHSPASATRPTPCTACRGPESRSWCATTSTRCAAPCHAPRSIARPQTLWRYRELLPVRHAENVVSLGEVVTPLIGLPRLAKQGELLVKDEGRLPTGSFKARGLVLAVSMAKELGVTAMAMPTNGNAGAAMAAYCARAGIAATVFCPDDTPDVNVARSRCRAPMSISSTASSTIAGSSSPRRKGARLVQLFYVARALPDRGQEDDGDRTGRAARWEVPDVIFYPTGGGTGIIACGRPSPNWRRSAGSARKAPAHGRGPGIGLRTDGQGLARRCRARPALARRTHLRRRH